MISCISSKLESAGTSIRKFGRKIFDIPEMEASVYSRRSGNTDILTVLDKNYNRLFVEKVKMNDSQKREITTQIFSPGGRVSSMTSTSTAQFVG